MKVLSVEFGPINNYCHAIYTESGNTVALVDPADFITVERWMKSQPALANLQITHVMTTHKHEDHSYDNPLIEEDVPGVKIIGGAADNVKGCNMPINDGDKFEIQPGLEVICLQKPCHTRGHTMYYITDSNASEEDGDIQRAVFTGDMVFVGGAGHFFEGDGQEAWTAFCAIRDLPDDTIIFSGHEYALANYKWAITVDENNVRIQERLAWAETEREAGRQCHSTVGEEKQSNIFMRADQVMEITGANNPGDSIWTLREWKTAASGGPPNVDAVLDIFLKAKATR